MNWYCEPHTLLNFTGSKICVLTSLPDTVRYKLVMGNAIDGETGYVMSQKKMQMTRPRIFSLTTSNKQ
jgi:hypothetical protein